MTRWAIFFVSVITACSDIKQQTITDYWPNGNVKRELVVVAGDTTAITIYDEAGRLSKICRWSKGEKHGKWEAYYLDGKPWSFHQYKRGVQVGAYHTWHPNGEPFITGQYDSIGNPAGIWRFFDDKGHLIKEEIGPSVHN